MVTTTLEQAPIAVADPRTPGAPARLLVIGTNALAQRLVEVVRQARPGPYVLVGTVGDVPREGLSPAIAPWLGPLEELPRILDADGIDCAVVALDDQRAALPLRGLVHARARGIRFERAADLYERLTGKIAVEALTPRDVIFTTDFPHRKIPGTFARVASALPAGIALVVSAPLMALLAAAIKLDSTGPVLFIHDRVGFHGRTFRLFKFRTMHPDPACASEWVRDNGHRVTRLGYWLRRFRLDELPQLFNIVRGEMNLVGPRPHPATNYALLATVMRNLPETGADIPYYSLRTLVRPGITGWAQVRFGYANGVVEEIEKLRYDLYYVKHRSMWLDLRILAETVRVVLFSRTFEKAESPGRPAGSGNTSVTVLRTPAGPRSDRAGSRRRAP